MPLVCYTVEGLESATLIITTIKTSAMFIIVVIAAVAGVYSYYTENA